MSYTIEEVRGSAPIEDEIAAFLAEFVRKGELPEPNPGEEHAEIWRMRLDWWWRDNPFFHEDTLKALLLKSPDGELVGFHGFIPHDYERDGTIIPSLIATTFFVAEAHRDAALGVFLKVKRLTATHHIVDGTPSEKVREILDRFKFQSCREGSQHYFFTKNTGWHPRSLISRASSILNGVTAVEIPGSRLVHDPAEIASICRRPHDGSIHRRITLDGLNWAASVGTSKRHFVGLVDRNDQLLSYFIGFPFQKYSIRAVRLVDYANFGGEAMDYSMALISQMCRHPENSPLATDTDLFIWPILNAQKKPGGLLQRSWDCNLYYKTPREFESYERLCVPFEGDGVLL